MQRRDVCGVLDECYVCRTRATRIPNPFFSDPYMPVVEKKAKVCCECHCRDDLGGGITRSAQGGFWIGAVTGTCMRVEVSTRIPLHGQHSPPPPPHTHTVRTRPCTRLILARTWLPLQAIENLVALRQCRSLRCVVSTIVFTIEGKVRQMAAFTTGTVK